MMQLYKVFHEVCPATERPAFWHTGGQLVYACVHLFARSEEDASKRASIILHTLPYKVTGHAATVAPVDDDANPDPMFTAHEKTARLTGLSLCLMKAPARQSGVPTDGKIVDFTSEGVFEGHPKN